MGRGNLAQRLTLYVRAATEGCPSLAGRTVTPHTIRHTTAMHLLQSGVDIAVIALGSVMRARQPLTCTSRPTCR